MKNKPIKIDWDELEEAFTNTREDVVSFLDRVTGRVLLEGEGEEDDLDDDEAGLGSPLNESRVRDDPMRLYVHPPGPERKLVWMKEFIAANPGKKDQEVLDRLTEAMGSEDPPAALTAVLDADAELRDAWFLYRSDRLHEVIEEWLKSNEVTPIDPPPWN